VEGGRKGRELGTQSFPLAIPPLTTDRL